MPKRKSNDAEKVVALAKDAKDAYDNNQLYEYAKRIGGGQNPSLSRYLNSYPAIPFQVDADDIKGIISLKSLPKLADQEHKWTPWEKLFYAQLWKDGKLKSTMHIISGLESAQAHSSGMPTSAVVYHYFGRHLYDRLNEPILDQHSVRAYKLIMCEQLDNTIMIEGIRESTLPTADEAGAYRSWFKQILEKENIDTYEESRVIDTFLYAFGKYSKV